MKIVFLSSEADHHYFIINSLHRKYHVHKVFLQTCHKTKSKSRWARFKSPKTRWILIRNMIARLLFSHKEQMLEREFEQPRYLIEGQQRIHLEPEHEEVYSFNDPETVRLVAAEEPDLIIVCGTSILKGEILEIAKVDILNIHRSIIPLYRGGGHPYWAYYHNDFKNLGATIHRCTKQLDGGEIVAQEFYKLEPGHRIYMYRFYTSKLVAEMLPRVLKAYSERSVSFAANEGGRLWRASDLTLWIQLLARFRFHRHIVHLRRLSAD